MDALESVEQFAREIPALAGRPDLKQHATRTLEIVEQVRAMASGEPKEQVEAARALATEIGAIVERL